MPNVSNVSARVPAAVVRSTLAPASTYSIRRNSKECPVDSNASARRTSTKSRGASARKIDRWIVLVVPALDVPTAAVYANVSQPVPPVHGNIALAGSDDDVRATLYNDLERPALAAVPALARWRSLLDATQPGFRMSGSGSAFFAVFSEHGAATACADAVRGTADQLGLETRGCWVTRPAGHAVR